MATVFAKSRKSFGTVEDELLRCTLRGSSKRPVDHVTSAGGTPSASRFRAVTRQLSKSVTGADLIALLTGQFGRHRINPTAPSGARICPEAWGYQSCGRQDSDQP